MDNEELLVSFGLSVLAFAEDELQAPSVLVGLGSHLQSGLHQT